MAPHTAQGAGSPPPLGGDLRLVELDIGPDAMRSRSETLAEVVIAAALLGTAVLWASWPLAWEAGRVLPDPIAAEGNLQLWSRLDLDLVVWTLAWTARALATAPASLFEANVFHPAPNTLAASEHFLGLAPIAAPVFLSSGDAALTYVVTILAVVWLTAFATFLAVRAWTGSATAGLFAGIVLGLCPYSVGGWARLHWSAFSLLPALFLLGRRAAAEPRAGRLLLLFALTALQALAGMYIAFQAAVALVLFLPVLLAEARRRRRSPAPALLALVLGGLCLVPAALPYLHAQRIDRDFDFEAALRVMRLTSRTPAELGAELVENLSAPVLALAGIGLLWARRPDVALRLSLAAIALAGFLLACGPDLPLFPGSALPGPFRIAMDLVPGFARMRTAVRFLSLPLLALALLAGLGAADVLARLRRRSRLAAGAAQAALLAGALVLLVARVQATPAAFSEAPPHGIERELYDWLRDQRAEGAVLELPVPSSGMDFASALATGRAMIGSTIHWRPLVNGYSGHPPSSAPLLLAIAQRLPDPGALEDLCSLAFLRYLVVRTDLLLNPIPWESATEDLGLREVARFGSIRVLEVDRECGWRVPELRAEIVNPAPAKSLHGIPLEPLPPEAMQGGVTAILGSPFAGGAIVRVINESAATWPGLTTAQRGRVSLGARWRGTDGQLVRIDPPVPLARDLSPGERLRTTVISVPPARPGRYLLEIGLLQEGVGWFADRSGRGLFQAALEVRPGRTDAAVAAPAEPRW